MTTDHYFLDASLKVDTPYGDFTVRQCSLWNLARYGLCVGPGVFFSVGHDVLGAMLLIAALLAYWKLPISKWLRVSVPWYTGYFFFTLSSFLLVAIILRTTGWAQQWGILWLFVHGLHGLWFQSPRDRGAVADLFTREDKLDATLKQN